MTEPLTDAQLAAITALIGDTEPATNSLLGSLAESVRDRRQCEHPRPEDFFCNNLTAWAGERIAFVLRRLVNAEAEVQRLRAEIIGLEDLKQRALDKNEQLRAELAEAREARLEWSRIGDHPELAHWADSLVGADLTPHPAFAWCSTTTGYEIAVQVATTDELKEAARTELLAELQAVFDATICRVLGYRSATTAIPEV